jgi:hypothetical protein
VLFGVSDIALKYLTGALDGGVQRIVSEWTLAAYRIPTYELGIVGAQPRQIGVLRKMRDTSRSPHTVCRKLRMPASTGV